MLENNAIFYIDDNASILLRESFESTSIMSDRIHPGWSTFTRLRRWRYKCYSLSSNKVIVVGVTVTDTGAIETPTYLLGLTN